MPFADGYSISYSSPVFLGNKIQVTANVRITDNLSGLKTAIIAFPGISEIFTLSSANLYAISDRKVVNIVFRISGNSLDGIYQIRGDLGYVNSNGYFSAAYINMTDVAGNYIIQSATGYFNFTTRT